MAKGDAQNASNVINQQGSLAQGGLNNLNQRQSDLYNNLNQMFNQSSQQSQKDYGNMMGQYQNYLTNLTGGVGGLTGGAGTTGGGPGNLGDISAKPPAFTLDPTSMARLNEAGGNYSNFAQTGGFSPQNIQDIRARSIAPTRALYAQGQANAQRANTLAGGNMANAGAVQAKMARDLSNSVSDANVNANAGIAQMIQQGKLAGNAGLSSVGQAGAGLGLQSENLRNQAQLEAMRQMGSLYGTTPGQANMFGNQLLNMSNQGLGSQELQNQLSLGLIRSAIEKGQLPSDFSQFLGNAGGGLGLFGNILNLFKHLPAGGGGGSSSQQPDGPVSTQE